MSGRFPLPLQAGNSVSETSNKLMSDRIRSVATTGVVVTLAVALASCSAIRGRTVIADGPAVPPPAASSLSQYEGSWLHSEGIFRAEFKEGRFVSVSPQTGDRLAAGSYVASGSNKVSLDFATSSGSRSTANCTLVGVTLNCVQGDGRTFRMSRSA